MSEYFGCGPTSTVPSRVATERSPVGKGKIHQLAKPKESPNEERVAAIIVIHLLLRAGIPSIEYLYRLVCSHLLLGSSGWFWWSQLSNYWPLHHDTLVPLIGTDITTFHFTKMWRPSSLAYLAWRSCTTLPSGRSKTHIPQGHTHAQKTFCKKDLPNWTQCASIWILLDIMRIHEHTILFVWCAIQL